jgi:GcrA cell cycle regulator
MAAAVSLAVPAVSTPGGQAPALLTLLERRFAGISVEREGWTDAAHVALRTLWAEGHPSALIGRVLGCGKNAVIGKAHRLKLEGRVSPVTGLAAARPARQAKTGRRQSLPRPAGQRALPQPVAEVAPEAPPVVFRARAPGECCWPMWGDKVERGDPGYGRFCCAPAPGGQRYCPQHRATSAARVKVAA